MTMESPTGYFADILQERLQEETRKALEDLDEVSICLNSHKGAPRLTRIIATSGNGKQIIQH